MLILVDVLESIDFGRGEDSFDTEEGEGEGDVESDLVIDPFPATLPTLGIVDDGGLPFETSGMLDRALELNIASPPTEMKTPISGRATEMGIGGGPRWKRREVKAGQSAHCIRRIKEAGSS